MDRIIKTQKELLKSRIVYNQELFSNEQLYNQIIDDLLEDSKFIALSILFPYEDYSDMDLPSKYNNWQIRASIELFNMADKSTFISYSENGINFSKLTDGLSVSLINELTPKAGIPKRKEIVVE